LSSRSLRNLASSDGIDGDLHENALMFWWKVSTEPHFQRHPAELKRMLELAIHLLVTRLEIPEGYAATNRSQNSLNTDENLPNTQDRHKSGVAKLINRNFNLHAFGFTHAKNRCVVAILMNFYSR
jgi:hypothetical protein